jgi:hypothetical protein
VRRMHLLRGWVWGSANIDYIASVRGYGKVFLPRSKLKVYGILMFEGFSVRIHNIVSFLEILQM